MAAGGVGPSDDLSQQIARATSELETALGAGGCFLFGAFAVVAFFRGCAALEQDVERLFR